MNNITLNWSAEDRARIDKLNELLTKLVESGERPQVIVDLPTAMPVKPAETPQNDEQAEPEKVVEALEELPGQVTFDELPVPVEETPAPKYEQADVLAKVQALIKAGKKAETRAVVTKYAASVSSIPVEKYPEVMAELTALEG